MWVYLRILPLMKWYLLEREETDGFGVLYLNSFNCLTEQARFHLCGVAVCGAIQRDRGQDTGGV